MRAAVITKLREPLQILEVPDPPPAPAGVVLRVEASGVCRSDWHAWMGHEPLPALPHVLGHEMAGTVESIGAEVERWQPGDRVTVPFSIGCGQCSQCRAGHLNTCDQGFTPGFTHWGSFAERVAIDHADVNLVALPDEVGSVEAAALGCRFVTAFRAVADRGRIEPGQWLSVYGAGGVGLSAVMVGKALDARVAVVDINEQALQLATDLGADVTVNATLDNPVAAIREATEGGAHVSIDALGSTATLLNSVRSLRKHGRHVQVGLMLAGDAAPPLPMEQVIMRELDILGSRGISATDYPRVLKMISAGLVEPSKLVTATISLEDLPAALAAMGDFTGAGVTVIDRL